MRGGCVEHGGSYELVDKPWAHFVLTVGRVNTEVAWTREEILVESVNFRCHYALFQIYIVILLLVNHFNRNAASNFVKRGRLGSVLPFAQLRIRRRRCDAVDLLTNVGEGHLSSGCHDRNKPFSNDATHELSMLRSVVAAVDGSVSTFAVSGDLHKYAEYCGH